MNGGVRISPFEAVRLDDVRGDVYDAALGSLGFEARCCAVPAALGINGVAAPFDDRRDELSYADNKRWFDGNDWQVPEIEEVEFFDWMGEWLVDLASKGEPTRVAIDVSSMSRRRMAEVIEALFLAEFRSPFDVDFLYTPARFDQPGEEADPPVFSVAPVTPFLAGWWNDLEAPLMMLVGLGYERERAASAVDVLEPAAVTAWVPTGRDPNYLPAVRAANAGLKDSPGVQFEPERSYPVWDPFTTFIGLEAQLDGLVGDYRVALVPLGPKIFAACCMLAAAMHADECQVIRVSAGSRELATQAATDGDLFGLTASFGKREYAGAFSP